MSWGEYDYSPRSEKQTFRKSVNSFMHNIVDTPVTWIREKIVEPNRPEYYWYHRRYPRVPTVDQCYTDDLPCIMEADEQFKRDKKVDATIVRILKKRYENCMNYETMDDTDRCQYLREAWDKALTNAFIKYGELGWVQNSVGAYMKQKHRMIWERRYGPVGTGMDGKNISEQQTW